MKRRFVTVDVFTEQQFGGNPLAVVLDAQGLSTEKMQAIATEFNYAECTFVLPPRDAQHTAQVRIFTPHTEVPFAGHPNVGTAYVLARYVSSYAGLSRMVFEEIAGLVPVDIISSEGRAVGAELTAPQPLTYHSRVPVDALAECLYLKPTDIKDDEFGPQVISVGLPFLVAKLKTRDALRRAKPNLAAHAAVLPQAGVDAIYLFTRDIAASDPPCDVTARMFAPLDGIPEDPATGSATAAVAAMLAQKQAHLRAEVRMHITQGVDMGRTSLLRTRVAMHDGRITAVHVGGHCVQVMEGFLTLAER